MFEWKNAADEILEAMDDNEKTAAYNEENEEKIRRKKALDYISKASELFKEAGYEKHYNFLYKFLNSEDIKKKVK